MKKLKRISFYVATNAAWVTAGYFGLFRDVAWASNLFWFELWFVVFAATVVFIGVIASKTYKADILARGRSVPMFVDVAFDLVIMGFLVVLGHFLAGAAYLWHMLCVSAIYSKRS